MKEVTLSPSKKFYVGKILCLGQNYADHAKEMGSQAPSSPVVFLKPPSAIISNGEDIVLPEMSKNVHHEVELTVLIGRRVKNISHQEAFDAIAGYGIGLDMTMRDVQGAARKAGNPWSIAKGFDTSAALSPFVPSSDVPDPHNLDIFLKVNGVQRQRSKTSKMIYKIDFIVSYLSSVFTLDEGDVIYTGTPEGVGQVVAGDVIDAEIPGVGTLHHRVSSAQS
jgi:2-keto-4-pentenoate hydratase/2-oxohepta-3-ene-1,7-dioic acid hydratase in catechol pathway